jgi:hypothetical protein
MNLILDQYEIKIKSNSNGNIICEINHHYINNSGGDNITPIGFIIITKEEYSEPFLPHNRIQLFLRNDVRLDLKFNQIIVVSNPEGQAGSDKNLLKYLNEIKNSNMPFYSEKLPDEIINYLLINRLCEEPIGMNICHFSYNGFREKGQLWEED